MQNRDLEVRNGAILAIGEICGSLPADCISLLCKDKLEDLLNNLPASHMETFGSEITISSYCNFIRCFSSAGWPVSEETKSGWRTILYQTFRRSEQWLHDKARDATEKFCAQYGCLLEDVQRCIGELRKAEPLVVRRGLAMMLGSLDPTTLSDNLEEVFNVLIESAKIKVNAVANCRE